MTKVFLRKYLVLLVICTALGLVIFIFTHYSVTGLLPSLAQYGKSLVFSILFSIVVGLLAFHTDKLLDKFMQWRAQFLPRFIIGLSANIAWVLLILTITFANSTELTRETALKLAILYIIAVFIYEIFYGLFYSYHYYAVTQVEQLHARRWQMELQFESLKSQISPHTTSTASTL